MQIYVSIFSGNRDIGNDNVTKTSFSAFEASAMQLYFYFEFGGRYWFNIDTQCYKLDTEDALKQRAKQDDWLKSTLAALPKSPKTMFQHTPLFLENVDEVKASDKLKSLFPEHRHRLLDWYSSANVDTVFSGHVHFNNVPPVYNGVQQIVMTSINHQNHWISKETGIAYGPNRPAFIVARVQQGEINWQLIELEN